MYGRMIINDIKTNKLVSAAACIFMAVTAMLLGLSILLYLSLGDSIDSLMSKAETPDFLQMHAGGMIRALSNMTLRALLSERGIENDRFDELNAALNKIPNI